MASLTNVINILTPAVRDVKNPKKMLIPLNSNDADLVHCLGRLKRHSFRQWHRTQLDWVYSAAGQNESLKRLCKAVASALQFALRKAELLRDHLRYKTSLSRFWSSRHVVVSALVDVLRAFEAFRAVHEEPDLKDHHIRIMVRRYLRETFDLMFLFGKFASLEQWYCLWEASLVASNFEDFRFDSDSEYSRLDRPQMENTNLSGVLEDPAQISELCLPNYPAPPALVKNPGPYGARVYENPLGGLQSKKNLPFPSPQRSLFTFMLC
jgi:hypothetical protein